MKKETYAYEKRAQIRELNGPKQREMAKRTKLKLLSPIRGQSDILSIACRLTDAKNSTKSKLFIVFPQLYLVALRQYPE
jgi:hypothetical protein